MKVVFIRHQFSLLIPSLNGGGGIEIILSSFLDEHEKDDNNKNEFYFIQSGKHDKNDIKKVVEKFKKTKFIFVKFSGLVNFFQRAINKLFKIIFGHKKKYFFPYNYNKKVFKQVVKINPDIIIFEGYMDSYIKKYEKHFGKDRLYVHWHSDPSRGNYDLIDLIGGTISVSEFVASPFINNSCLTNYILKNCINDKVFSNKITSSERVELREKLGFNKDDFVVIFCGRVVKEKGVLELIDAIENTPNNVKLLVVGGTISLNDKQTPYIKKVSEMVQRNPDKIKFTGYVLNSELYKYYQSADLQVIPTLIEEAAGLVVIEGQACGLPQIITNSGGMPEYATNDTIILEKDNNLVKNLAVTITQLCNDKEKLQRMSMSSIKNAKEYTLNNYYNNFNIILDDIYKRTQV